MRGAFIIAGKDLRNFFLSPLFYIVAGTCSVIWWVFFALGLRNFIAQSAMQMYQAKGTEGLPLHFAVVYGFVSMVNLIMILAVSAVTMRLFTEEKRNRTFDLLLTAPVTSTEIVVGKLIAGIVTAWALIAVASIYPLSLFAYGANDWGPMASSFLGLLLLCAGYVSVGMFASSITTSAVVSVILALILQMSLWFVGAIAEGASDPTSRSLIEHLSVGEHFQDFMKGNPSLGGVVYFVSLVFLFTFLTRQVVESARWR
jgi:ABC-2 type transport system permease protein